MYVYTHILIDIHSYIYIHTYILYINTFIHMQDLSSTASYKNNTQSIKTAWGIIMYFLNPMHQRWFLWQMNNFMLLVSLTSFGLSMEKTRKISFPQKINSLSNYQSMQQPVILPVLSYFFFLPDTSIFCQHCYFSKHVSLFTAFPVISLDVSHCVIPQEERRHLKISQ